MTHVGLNLWNISFGKAGNHGEADHDDDDDDDVDGYEYFIVCDNDK